MKRNRSSAAFALICGLCLTTSCRQAAPVTSEVRPLDSNVVATVQGAAIGQESFQRKLKERFGADGASLSVAKGESALEELIGYEAVYAQARAAKFDEQPEIAARIKNLIVRQFIERQMETGEPQITREQSQEYYTNHQAEFLLPFSVRGAVIFLRASARMEPGKREALKQRAGLVLAEAQQTKSEADFARLVQRCSEHQATRYRGGDLGWMTRAEGEAKLGPEVSTALFRLTKPDEFSPLLEASDGFYILKLQELREARLRPLEEVAELIRYQLTRQHRLHRETEFHARMKRGLEIQINRALLESISVPSPDQNPPALPGARLAQRNMSQ